LHDPTMTGRNLGTSHTPSPPSNSYAMDVDATHTSGNSRESFVVQMRGRCYGCGAQNHEKKNCSYKDTVCRYCGRRGHLESVCQDKFMGLERGRGKRSQPRRQQVSASSSIPFTLFPNESVQIATSARSCSCSRSCSADSAQPRSLYPDRSTAGTPEQSKRHGLSVWIAGGFL
ncbi:hypothetical protein DFJ43DRAFT_1058411, partial [Lentinula guzmanii]